MWVFANGIGQSVLPYGDTHSDLGALPVIGVIGLGSGDTVFSAGGRSQITQITQIDSIEIIESELESLRRLTAARVFPGLPQLLNDPADSFSLHGWPGISDAAAA